MHPPCASIWSRASTADLTLHVEEDGGVVGLPRGWVRQGAVELVVAAPGGESEGAGGAHSRAVCLLLLAIKVPRQHGTWGWLGSPAGEDTALPLPQRAHCQRLPIDGGTRLPQPCRRARGMSELQQHPAGAARVLDLPPLQPHLPSRTPGGPAAAAAGQKQPPAGPRNTT